MINKLYFCENCRIPFESVDQMHFVEDNAGRGFCGEKCILEFYSPYMRALESEEVSVRDALKLPIQEAAIVLASDETYLSQVLDSPDEVWLEVNDLEQEYYTHISKLSFEGKSPYFITVCCYIDKSPSFVFYKTLTESEDLVNHYRRGTCVKRNGTSVDVIASEPAVHEVLDQAVSAELAELAESKKSILLAHLLESRREFDIPFEQFMDYESYVESVMENPDEAYQWEDDEGDILYNFIRTFQKGTTTFYYVVIAIEHKQEMSDGDRVIFPVVGFPSIDENLYQNYIKGKRIKQHLEN